MPPPDLSTPEARAAYARELAGVGRPWRWLGLGLVAVGLGIAVSIDHIAARIIGWTFVALGWLQALAGIAIRRAYHRRRMQPAEPDPLTEA